jgi:hypothetical protein
MRRILSHETVAGFDAPVHRALTAPILLGGAPRAVAFANGTLAAAVGLGGVDHVRTPLAVSKTLSKRNSCRSWFVHWDRKPHTCVP